MIKIKSKNEKRIFDLSSLSNDELTNYKGAGINYCSQTPNIQDCPLATYIGDPPDGLPPYWICPHY